MYICEKCGEIFSTPEWHNGIDRCPGCGNKYFDEAVYCKVCNDYVSNDDAYGYGSTRVCKDCIETKRDDLDFLATVTEDTQDVEIPILYRYLFDDDDIKAMLYHAAKRQLELGFFDARDFIDDYANDIAEAMVKEENEAKEGNRDN